jgi:acetyl esterase/lipase
MVGFTMRLSMIVLAILASIGSLAVLCLVIGAFADPTGSLFAVVGSMVWTTYGPFLFLFALVALLIGVSVRVCGSKRIGTLTLALSSLALAGAGYILTRIVVAAATAGGTVNLSATLSLEAMTEPAPDVVETFNVVNGTELRAAVFRPAQTNGSAPVIVYIHGGGFQTGTFTETAADLRWFADQGWLVVSVEYRLFTPGNPTWDKASRDASCGLVWAIRNAVRFGGDPERLAVLGDSAGGNLAINIGFSAAAGRATSDCGALVPPPKAIATLYPAVDVASIYNDGFPIPGFEPTRLIEGYLGGPPDAYPERVKAVSPITRVTADAPPTLIILPKNDSLVVARGTEAFAQEAEAAGADVELALIPFANHVFNQLASNSLGNQIGRAVRLRFLEEHVR